MSIIGFMNRLTQDVNLNPASYIRKMGGYRATYTLDDL